MNNNEYEADATRIHKLYSGDLNIEEKRDYEKLIRFLTDEKVRENRRKKYLTKRKHKKMVAESYKNTKKERLMIKAAKFIYEMKKRELIQQIILEMNIKRCLISNITAYNYDKVSEYRLKRICDYARNNFPEIKL